MNEPPQIESSPSDNNRYFSSLAKYNGSRRLGQELQPELFSAGLGLLHSPGPTTPAGIETK